MTTLDQASIICHDIDLTQEGRWFFRADSHVDYRPLEYGTVTCDPFPAYPHNAAAVQDAVDCATASFAPFWDVHLFSLNREEIGRTNGHSNLKMGGHYEDDPDDPEGPRYVRDRPVGYIVLSGKRIPPHPAVTRYLVAHEYGHNVENMLNLAHGETTNPAGDRLLREYTAMRGLSEDALHFGSGGRWHDSAAEIFACDFRILMCGIETEYWPHKGIDRPEFVAGLSRWWSDQHANWSDLNARIQDFVDGMSDA